MTGSISAAAPTASTTPIAPTGSTQQGASSTTYNSSTTVISGCKSHGLTKEGAAFLALLALASGKKNKDKEMSLMEKLALLAIAFGPKEHQCAAMQQFSSSMNIGANADMVMNSGVSAVTYTQDATLSASAPTGALYSTSV